ncbi:hypothetical protein PVBG_05860 [Plasmodium vivax Brazil I]|uniref:Variable surface protein Vir7-like protein n=1 Tax=Plasmodium vivax (strain Brazil I) TaxID=1033975 RepID=A0A0J9VNK9_PLAV1|nr:hypothetical protein PVBG_05860 [Plasmodium vivax Brazil I]
MKYLLIYSFSFYHYHYSYILLKKIIYQKHELEGGIWNKNISDELLNALCYVYIKKENNTLNENLCNYLYYWLGSKVLTNLRLKDFFFDVITRIYRILNESELGKICDPAEHNIYNHNFQKFKDIYDLSEDYNTYKSHFIIPNPSCDKNYQDKLKTYVYLYNKLRDECSIEKTNYNAQYCKVFNKYFSNERHSEITSWKCKLKESEQQVVQLEEKPRKDAENETLLERRGLIVGQKLYRQGLLETEEFAEHLGTQHTGLRAENTVMGSVSDHPDNSPPSTVKKSITSAVSAAGLLVPPFLVYHVIAIVIVQRDVLCYI